jgi:hypothetical protein
VPRVRPVTRMEMRGTRADRPSAVGLLPPAPVIRRCTFCASTAIRVSANGRILWVVCETCDAVFIVEFDPPDAPGIRGRIETVQVPATDWTVH